MKYNIAENNFDLIRLFAASQVAILHVMGYMFPAGENSPIAIALDIFPGVPIFFFISGFLISRSYEKTASVGDYARNRSLRIFPALHVCVIINLILVASTGYFATMNTSFPEILVLYLAKTTLFQFYNPDFMRHFGDGVLNGSLWTICVELQFYFATPIIYRLFVSQRKTTTNIAIGAIIVGSLLCNRSLYALQPAYFDSNYWKLARVSFLPWIYMFLSGVIVQINFNFFAKLLRENSFILALPLYVAYALIMRKLGLRMDNGISPLLFFPLVFTLFIAAFSAPSLAKKTLRGNDISYGIYIYHVPIMNMFLYYNYRDSLMSVIAILAITIAAALASWFFIERPALSRKRRAARPLTAAA